LHPIGFRWTVAVYLVYSGAPPLLGSDREEILMEADLLPSRVVFFLSFLLSAVLAFGATLASCFGISNADLPAVFPNIGRFGRSNLGFLGQSGTFPSPNTAQITHDRLNAT
jgi:hypothetical protein